MKNPQKTDHLTRRNFLRTLAAGAVVPYATRLPGLRTSAVLNHLYWVKGIPDLPFYDPAEANHHLGLDSLLYLMADKGLKFYRTSRGHLLGGPAGLIAARDVVLLKVNAQWKYRGCTNSDLIRGLIQRILDHPDGFAGEVVILENGQGRGSLRCDTSKAYGGDTSVHANANDESHHFLHLVDTVFNDPRVSACLLDPIRANLIGEDEHDQDGYRTIENVSYPCFATAGGNRVELGRGIWRGGSYRPNLKLINVPVLKHHDTGGSEITAGLKHMYGVVSMSDGQTTGRHYDKLGDTCGKMMVSVVKPVLNIIDAIWVSHSSLGGYPAETTFRANQLLAGQDPVAADYWAAKHILYPVDGNDRHHPDFSGIDHWLSQAAATINSRGGLRDAEKGIVVGRVTKSEAEMRTHSCQAGDFLNDVRLSVSDSGLVFAALSGEVMVPEKPLAVAVSGARPLAWRIETNARWLRCEPASGKGNATVMVSVHPGGLEPGIYTGRLAIYCPGAANSPLVVSVTLKLRERGGRTKLGTFSKS